MSNGNGIAQWRRRQERFDELNSEVADVLETEHSSMFGYGLHTGERSYHTKVIEYNNTDKGTGDFIEIFGCTPEQYRRRRIEVNRRVGRSEESKKLDTFLAYVGNGE